MDPTVRKQKSGDQLAVGDWLAPGALMERPAEVLFVYTYDADADAVASGLAASQHGVKQVQLVVREQGRTGVWPDLAAGNTLFALASEEDLAAHREKAERARTITDLRAFVDFLDRNPWAPAPYLTMQADIDRGDVWNGGAEGVAQLRKVADGLGEKPDVSMDDRSRVVRMFGTVEYKVIAWHRDGRPAEPAPPETEDERCPDCGESMREIERGTLGHIPGEICAPADEVPEHQIARGWKGDGPGACGAECTCGVTYDGFDSLNEAGEFLRRHIADPTGQDYGRADTAEADDPTPVSGARVEAHTGEMVGTTRDARLVDADAPEQEGRVFGRATVDGETSYGRQYFEDGGSNAQCSDEELEGR